MTPGPVPGAGVPAGGGRPLRADARRNRARVLEAAEEVFAAEGASASTEEIARRAGVGVGTVFRHFPKKDALLEAMILGRVRRFAEYADALVAEGGPETALFAFFRRAAEESAAKKSFSEMLAGGAAGADAADRGLPQGLGEKIEALLVRARDAGAVRGDVRVPEVVSLFVATLRIAEHAKGDDRLRERTLEILLDGLRPAGRR